MDAPNLLPRPDFLSRFKGSVVNLLRLLGVDRAILYTVMAGGWSVISGPITLLFIAAFLSREEQGFYYTFANILGLQILFELGLSQVILQFASHEKAKLEWTPQGTLQGDEVARARLASLLRVALTWYGVVALLVLMLVLPGGLLFFGRYQPDGSAVAWQWPWSAIVIITVGTLFITPAYAVLEGCGLIAEIARVRVWQGVGGSLLVWLALSHGWKLLAGPLLGAFGLLTGLGWLWIKRRAVLLDLARLAFRNRENAVGWWSEVWPFQWRIALSWGSGYFISQLFNPILFAFHGPVAAGRMGMSLSIVATIGLTALSWVSTKAAPFGFLIANREWKKLDRLFFSCLWQSFPVVALGGAAFWMAAFYLRQIHHPLSQRFLEPLPLGLLIATAAVNHIWFAQAIYLRAHKQEPFLLISILTGFIVGPSAYLLGRPFGATGMMAGYLAASAVLGLGVGSWIFMRKRREWHS